MSMSEHKDIHHVKKFQYLDFQYWMMAVGLQNIIPFTSIFKYVLYLNDVKYLTL